jgi:hypothetical protein
MSNHAHPGRIAVKRNILPNALLREIPVKWVGCRRLSGGLPNPLHLSARLYRRSIKYRIAVTNVKTPAHVSQGCLHRCSRIGTGDHARFRSRGDAAKAEAGVRYLLGIMTDAFPDAMVDCSYYAHAISAMPNDEKDRHVGPPLLLARLTYWSRPT